MASSERGRGFLRDPYQAPAEARQLRLAGRAAGRDQALLGRGERKPQTLRLDRRARRHHREGPPWVSSVPITPLGTLAEALRALANKLTSEQAQVAVDPVLQAIKNTTH